MLIAAVTSAAMVACIALGVARLNQSAYNGYSNSKIMLQAQQYAEAEAAVVKATDYSSLVARNRVEIQNSNGYFSEITLSDESDYSDSVKQKTASIRIYRNGEALPRYTLDVLKTNAEVQAASGVPVGTIIAWPSSTAPTEGGTWLLCNGGSFSSSTYSKLYSVLGKTTLPSLNGRFLEGTTGTPGTTKSAGLPNITAYFETFTGSEDWAAPTGAIYWGTYRGKQGPNGDNYASYDFGFDASRCSSIYGASTTVQPASYLVRFYIKAL